MLVKKTHFSDTLSGPRHSHACAFWKNGFLKSSGNYTDMIIVAGGTLSDGTDTKIVEAYNMNANTGNWERLVDSNQPVTSIGSSANSIMTFNSRKMIIYGGSTSLVISLGDRRCRYNWIFERERFERYYITDDSRVNSLFRGRYKRQTL